MIGPDAQHRAIERLYQQTHAPRKLCRKALRACAWNFTNALENLKTQLAT